MKTEYRARMYVNSPVAAVGVLAALLLIGAGDALAQRERYDRSSSPSPSRISDDRSDSRSESRSESRIERSTPTPRVNDTPRVERSVPAPRVNETPRYDRSNTPVDTGRSYRDRTTAPINDSGARFDRTQETDRNRTTNPGPDSRSDRFRPLEPTQKPGNDSISRPGLPGNTDRPRPDSGTGDTLYPRKGTATPVDRARPGTGDGGSTVPARPGAPGGTTVNPPSNGGVTGRPGTPASGGAVGTRPGPRQETRDRINRNPTLDPRTREVVEWRTPTQPNRPDNVSTRPGQPGSVGRRLETRRPDEFRVTEVRRDHRPPRVDRGSWFDTRYRYTRPSRPTVTINLGFWDPWYTYNYGRWGNWRFYYPYYYVGPWSRGVYYSPYWCYDGWFPIYIWAERIIFIERRIYLRDLIVDDGYDLYGSYHSVSLQNAMDDIRDAWMDGQGGLLLRHVSGGLPVRIYRNGKYNYSLEPEDFRDMTKDALTRVETVGFEWTRIDRQASDEYYLEAKHTFYDPDGERRTIRLTYTLERASGNWWITETGTYNIR
ncbi:MAG: hypothetical protein GYA63_03300 [Armatimonadetes bacterium]|nr:hypothetical protein [Armatimonadota bacterium]HOC30778.1 hypothetical protein [Armatimonadota bacterium]